MPPPAPPTEVLPAVRVAVLLSCTLSALGCGLLVATHALWPDLRSRARRLLLFLSLADLLSAASYFYGALRDFAGPSWDCVLQGALSSFANTSSFFWTMAIALYLYLSIVHAARGPRADHLFWVFHVVRWVVAHRVPGLDPGPCQEGRALVPSVWPWSLRSHWDDTVCPESPVSSPGHLHCPKGEGPVLRLAPWAESPQLPALPGTQGTQAALLSWRCAGWKNYKGFLSVSSGILSRLCPSHLRL